MGLLTNELNQQIRNDSKAYGYSKGQFCLKTGFPLFDYLNGTVDYKDGKPIYNIGIDAGKSVMIVGKSGSGKSSLGIQLAASIMKKYDESTMFIYDFEQSHTKARIKSLTGMTDEYFDTHVTIKSTGIYTETILKIVKQIAKFKKEHEKELLTDNQEGVYGDDGKLVKILPPTIIFIDSIASMRTQDAQDGEEMTALTGGARNAIANKDLFNRILQPCMEANIIVISINHINDNLSMGVTPPIASTRYLKNTESISGGKAILYLSNLLIKIEAGQKLEEKDKYGIKGFIANISVIKSRNSEGGTSIDMIFNQKEGFDEDLSEFEFLKANNKIKGAGIGMYLDGLDTIKFRMSNIKEKLKTEPKFYKRFKELVDETLKEHIKVSSKLDTASSEETTEAEQPKETVEEKTVESEVEALDSLVEE